MPEVQASLADCGHGSGVIHYASREESAWKFWERLAEGQTVFARADIETCRTMDKLQAGGNIS